MSLHERAINFWEQVFLLSRQKGNTVDNAKKEADAALEEWVIAFKKSRNATIV